MADDKADKKKADDEGSARTADGSGGSTKVVELVDRVDPASAGLPGYIGVGMLGGVLLGLDPLRDAAQGNGPFEDAMFRFLACLLVCIAAASIIGRLLDGARGDERDDDQRAQPAAKEPIDIDRTGDDQPDRQADVGSS